VDPDAATIFATIISACLGVGLAASCGFRVFVPMLVASIATKAGLLTLDDGFAWVGTYGAIIAFSLATVLEIGAFYVPWIDNALDSIATPAAIVAGSVVAAACVSDMHPMLQWSTAIIAGGGGAGVVKAGFAGIRLGSTAVTGGVANPVVSTVEWIGALLLSILSVVVPVLAAVISLLLVAFLLRFAWRAFGNRWRRSQAQAKASSE
jgi:hypothetical protein